MAAMFGDDTPNPTTSLASKDSKGVDRDSYLLAVNRQKSPLAVRFNVGVVLGGLTGMGRLALLSHLLDFPLATMIEEQSRKPAT